MCTQYGGVGLAYIDANSDLRRVFSLRGVTTGDIHGVGLSPPALLMMSVLEATAAHLRLSSGGEMVLVYEVVPVALPFRRCAG